MSETLQVATIAALSALFGSAIGALSSYFMNARQGKEAARQLEITRRIEVRKARIGPMEETIWGIQGEAIKTRMIVAEMLSIIENPDDNLDSTISKLKNRKTMFDGAFQTAKELIQEYEVRRVKISDRLMRVIANRVYVRGIALFRTILKFNEAFAEEFENGQKNIGSERIKGLLEKIDRITREFEDSCVEFNVRVEELLSGVE